MLFCVIGRELVFLVSLVFLVPLVHLVFLVFLLDYLDLLYKRLASLPNQIISNIKILSL